MARRLSIVPGLSREECRRFIRDYHGHNDPPLGDIFRLGACEIATGRIVGVALVGRPIARALQDGWTVEVLRVAVRRDMDPYLLDRGFPGTCSFLYGAAWRAARALGYRRMQTYTLDRESGASLRALAGWHPGEVIPGRGWGASSKARGRTDKSASLEDKRRWNVCAGWQEGAKVPTIEHAGERTLPLFGEHLNKQRLGRHHEEL